MGDGSAVHRDEKGGVARWGRHAGDDARAPPGRGRGRDRDHDRAGELVRDDDDADDDDDDSNGRASVSGGRDDDDAGRGLGFRHGADSARQFVAPEGMSATERRWRRRFRKDGGRARVSIGTVSVRRGSTATGGPVRFGWAGPESGDVDGMRDGENSPILSDSDDDGGDFEDDDEHHLDGGMPERRRWLHSSPGNEGSASLLARQFVSAARRSDAFNEDDYDFAVVVRVALDAAQQRALEEAKRRADAIALASVTEVGGAAVPGLRRAYGSSGAIARIASPESVSANAGRVVRIAEDEEAVRSPPDAVRAIRFDGATTVDESFSESDSASQSDSDALSDSEDDFFGSSDSDFDVRDAGAHGTKYGPRALSPAAPRDGADIQVDVQPKAGAEGGGVARHTGRRRLRSSLGLDVSGGARHKCQEVLEALRRAGLKAKRVRSLNRRKWLIKVRAPEWRLEEEAERLRLRMRRRDGGWSKFRRSIRHAFAVALPWDERPGASVDEAALTALIAARGSLFHSSDRQTLIHHILRSSVREGGAELGSHTPLGAFVVQMFPLHMMARLRALRNDWLSIWRPEAALAELDRIGPAPADDTVPGGASRRQQRAAWAAAFAASQRQTAGHKAQLSNGVTEHPVPEGAVEPFSGKPPSASKRAAGAAARSVGSEGIGQAAGADADAEAAADGIAGGAGGGGGGGSGTSRPLDRIAAYFGETVAFYFAWLEFYTQWLVFPALVGAALFVAQVWYGTVDVTWVPLFSLFMALWSTLFLEFWKRRNAELAHRWGVLNYEHEEVTRPQFRGTWRRDSVTGEVFRVYRTWRRLMKYLVTVPVVMACTGAVVVFMILLFTTRDAILVGIEAAACDRGDVAPDSPMCQRGASAGSLWQPAVDWGILSPTATGKPAAPTDGLNTTATNRILATAATAQAGSTVTAVLGADAGNAAVGWAIRTSASAIVGSASTGRAALAALGLASSPGGALPAGPRRALGANGTNSDEGESGGLLGIGSLSALGVESFEEWISRSGDMEWWLAMLLPPVAYGFLIPIFDFAFGRLAFRFTDWENHKTESLFRNHRIAKVFVFRFVNSFISLFYYAFSPSSSLLQLTVQLASFLLAGQLWNTFLEVVFPCAWRWYKVCRFRQRVQRAVDSGLTEGRRGRRLLRHARSEAWAESRLAEYDTFNDYAEMLIQFGYVTFFSWAFPLAPLCALVNNVFEMRTDAYKLLYNTQRPIAYKAGGIGVWLGVLQGMSLLAVLTNCAHLALASKQFSLYFPGLTDAQKMLVVFLLEHAVLGVKLFLGSVIPHTPERVQKRVARDNFFLARLQGRRSVT
ncbi:hypothetical protein FNF29_03980 [Cafeteria roenbergensis]|uniref:Anoctamin transmembrane domain-containing protein n=1 Tax=Cafeteria roenbergensis TaxID=33653 RepID=A0A5A8CIV3_CAFRO|nr:hypothetical protein FNF29_03980 [Cafeteria roenbergensis]|eukprot:KAA0152414.1 hypothetical protein FNF29_03980 [Cafeteria roenbergensis]